MRPADVVRHEAQLSALARDLAHLGLRDELEVHSGRRGRWLVRPGQGVQAISSLRVWRQTGVHMVRVGHEVTHLTTDDLESVVLAAADLAVHGRATLGMSDAGEYCLTSTRLILLKHPARQGLWWFAGTGELAPLGRLREVHGPNSST